MATYIKVGGTWRTVSGDTESVCGYTKVGGVWKAVSDTYVKVAGTWRSVCAPTPPPPPPPPPPPDGGGGPVDPPQDSSVSSLSPSSGAAAGGITVTLNGSFPSNITNIGFGHQSANASSVTRVSSSQYTFTMPSGTAGITTAVQAFNGRTPLMGALTFTYNSIPEETNTCVNGNLCGNIVYADGTVVSISQINGTFNGSLRTEACGNGGTRTQAYTCVTPIYCPDIPVGVGQCVGETPTSGCGIMPDVVGLTESQASTLIVNKGINYEYTYDRTAGATAANDGTVYSQDPPAGTNVGSCNNSYNAGLTIYRYTAPPEPTCVCTPLTTTSGTQSVSTSVCASGIQNTTVNTYNQCCVTNNTVTSTTVTTPGSCVAQSTECSGAACSEARCQTCAALGTAGPNSYYSTRSVSTSVCASGTMNTYICWTPGSCANIISDTGCVAAQNCTPVYSGTQGRQCALTCGSATTTTTSVAISVNPCTGAESWQCPACSEPPPPPTSNCTTCNGSYPNSCGTYGNGTLCVTPSGCPNICYGGETPPPAPPPGCEPVRIYYENEYGDYCTALQNPCTGAITSVSCS